jgi:hypothetical protein
MENSGLYGMSEVQSPHTTLTPKTLALAVCPETTHLAFVCESHRPHFFTLYRIP